MTLRGLAGALAAQAFVGLQRKLGIYSLRDSIDGARNDFLRTIDRVNYLQDSLLEAVERIRASGMPVILFKARAKLPQYETLEDMQNPHGPPKKPPIVYETAWIVRGTTPTGIFQTQPNCEGVLTSVELLNSVNDMTMITSHNLNLLADGCWPANKEFPVPKEFGDFTPAHRIVVVVNAPAK